MATNYNGFKKASAISVLISAQKISLSTISAKTYIGRAEFNAFGCPTLHFWLRACCEWCMRAAILY